MGKKESIPSMLTIKLQVWYNTTHPTHEAPQQQKKKQKKQPKTQINWGMTTAHRDTDTNIIPSSPQTEKVAVHQL